MRNHASPLEVLVLLSDLSHSPDFRELTLGLLIVVATATAGSGHVLRSHQRLLDGKGCEGLSCGLCHRKFGIESSVVSGFSLQCRKEGGEKSRIPCMDPAFACYYFYECISSLINYYFSVFVTWGTARLCRR